MNDYKELYSELKCEYDEYVQSSQELEKALESELERCIHDKERYKKQTEKTLKTLSNNIKLTSNDLSKLQTQLQEANETISKLSTLNRMLEQEKDDLERNNRVINAKCEDLEEKLNTVEEDFVILSEEFEEMKCSNIETKRCYEEEIQHLQRQLDKKNRAMKHPSSSSLSVITKTPKRSNKSELIRAESENLASLARSELFENYATPTRLDMSMSSQPSDSIEYSTPVSTPFKQVPYTEPYNQRHTHDNQSNNSEFNSKNNSYCDDAYPLTPKIHHSRPRSLSHAESHLYNLPRLFRVLSSPPQSMDSLLEATSPIIDQHSNSGGSNSSSSSSSVNDLSMLDNNIVKNDNIMPILDQHIEKRYVYVLKSGHVFKKTQHRSVTRRFVWCSSTLGRILYGSADTRTVRGYLLTNQLKAVYNGGGRKIVLIGEDNDKTLELEAPDDNIHRDFLGAFQYLLQYENRKKCEWNEIINDGVKFNIILNKYRQSCIQLKHGEEILLKYQNKQRRRLLKFNDVMDRLCWMKDGKTKGHILFDDLCDVCEADNNWKSNCIEIRGLRKTVFVQFKSRYSKSKFLNNMSNILLYHKCLRSFV